MFNLKCTLKGSISQNVMKHFKTHKNTQFYIVEKKKKKSFFSKMLWQWVLPCYFNGNVLLRAVSWPYYWNGHFSRSSPPTEMGLLKVIWIKYRLCRYESCIKHSISYLLLHSNSAILLPFWICQECWFTSAF